MHERPSDVGEPNTQGGYDQTEPRNGIIVGAGIGVALLTALSYLIAIWLFDRFKDKAYESEPNVANAVANERPRFPAGIKSVPAPVLQKDEPADLKAFRSDEEQELSGYGWIDAKKEIVRIPVSEAMRMLAEPDFAKTKGIRAAPAAAQGGAK
jgi:hypothetical protein